MGQFLAKDYTGAAFQIFGLALFLCYRPEDPAAPQAHPL